ncbi:class D beta-lactamase [Pseudomonas sp. D47]|uniref:class D beta-lactamase n=1 Tax=Pseudomonas sp. D47 TaxID=3159447 RepID=UPI00387B2138
MLAACLATFSNGVLAGAQGSVVEVGGWKSAFDKLNTNGTIIIKDERDNQSKTFIYNKERSMERFTPASTFKIPHTLFALDFGVVRDEFQIFKWDGEKHEIPSHNADQNLRSAMRHSALWVYRGFAKDIGKEKATTYLKSISYGNQDASVKKRDYWVNGGLEVSAQEQIDFLEKLYRNQLPFKVEHQLLTKDIMVIEAGREWIIRSKTGLGSQVGWWVGWIEWPAGPVFFALNIDTPHRMADAHKREEIGRMLLKAVGALPPTQVVTTQ